MKRPTIALHGGSFAHPALANDTGIEPVVTPLVQSVNFAQPAGATDILYTRHGNTPNAQLIERRLAQLEGAESALVLASGMGATSCAMLALLQPGDHLVSSEWIYGGSRHLFTEELQPLGIDVTFIDPVDPASWEGALRPNTRALFAESPVNPTCRVLDIDAIAAVGARQNIPLVVDSTMASPINFRPLEHGAQVVIHSGTKYLNGHHDALSGVILGSAGLVNRARSKMIAWGQAPDPFACWLLERGLKTLDVRVQRHNANALALAQWCTTRPEFSAVHYPGLPTHPDHTLATRTLGGYGGMLAVVMAGGGDSATRFIERLQIVKRAGSLGGVDSLVSEPRFASHARMMPAQRAAAGIPDGFLRFSVGIEDVQDLIADFEQALR